MTTLTAAPQTIAGNLSAANIGDTVSYVQRSRPNLRDHFSESPRPETESVSGVLEAVFHVGNAATIRVDGVRYIVRHATTVTVARADGRPEIDYPAAPNRVVRPITPVRATDEYVPQVLPTPTDLPPGTRVPSFAGDVDASDLGHAIEFTVDDVVTVGVLETVATGPFDETVKLTVSGVGFIIPAGKPIVITVARKTPVRPKFYTR
jgi:hypothetical protein